MYKILKRNYLLQVVYFNKSEIERVLLLSCTFSMAMVLVRVLHTHSFTFVSMPWNLFLAVVPYLLSKWVTHHVEWIETKWKAVSVFTLWLLFIPNAFYIITDLFHLQETGDVPLWFDLALLLSFAWNGVMLGVLSVRQMEKIAGIYLGKITCSLFVTVIMFLNALGVYLGRYLRFNSWDVITNPFALAGDMYYLIFHPFQNRLQWGMIVCYTVLMMIIYATLKRISRAIE